MDLTEAQSFGQYKMKLLQFFENHRPAYYGTWRKSTRKINGRKPFSKDDEVFDYDFDSEAEWVADEDGEECRSDDEDDEDITENMSEPGEDDGWLVPHGYLSDDEGVEEDIDIEHKNLEKKNYPKPTKIIPLIPVILGPVFTENSYDEVPSGFPVFAQFTAQSFENVPIDPFKTYSNEEINPNSTDDIEKKSTKIVFPENYLNIFVEKIQYSLKGVTKIVDEAKEMEEFKDIPRIQIENKLKEIAVKEKPKGGTKLCWCVKNEIYEKLNMKKPDIPSYMKIPSPKANKVSPKKSGNSILSLTKSPTPNKNSNTSTKEPRLKFLPRKRKATSPPIEKNKNNTTEPIIIIDDNN